MADDMQNYAELENMTDKRIQVHIDWDTGAQQNTEVMPGDIAEIVCGKNTGVLCHRSDGGSGGCPAGWPTSTIKAGDFFQLEENGGFSV